MADKPKCGCGCGGRTGGGRFLPGHDAKLKSRIVELVQSNKVARAKQLAADQGWSGWLAGRLANTKPTPKPSPRNARIRNHGHSLRSAFDDPTPTFDDPTPAPVRQPIDIVLAAVARAPQSARYGGKVFIRDLYRMVVTQLKITLPEFKRQLLKWNREERLVLARLDMPGVFAHDLPRVEESEINDLGHSMHFVIDPDRNRAGD